MARRFLAAVVVPLLAVLVHAGPAAADDAVVVLDRGRAARSEARRHERMALRLVEALEARGLATRLVLYGSRPDGRIRAAALTGDLEDRLTRAAAKEGWRYEAPTDPRHALEVSLRDYEGSGPLRVFLVGPFAATSAGGAEPEGAEPAEGAEGERAGDGRGGSPGRTNGDAGADGDDEGAGGPREAEASAALDAWEERAPPDVRVFAPDLDAAGQAQVAGARGVVTAGAVVLAAGEAVATAAPWSPLAPAGPEADLRATVRVPLEMLTVGPGPRIPVLTAASSDGRGSVRVAGPGSDPEETGAEPPATGTVTFAVTRTLDADAGAARVETVSFEAARDATVLWLTDPPQPRTIQWTTLRPDARISWFASREGLAGVPVDGARPLDADPLLVGRPLARICRVEHTRVGDAPTWRVSATEGELPDGLAVSLGDVVNLTDEIAYRDLVLSLEARAGVPGSSAGSLALAAAGHPRRFEVPYRIVVPPGRVVVRLEPADAELRLPASEDAEAWTLVVEEERPNAPPLVRVEAVLDPPALATALTARLVGGGSVDVTWDLARPLEVRPGRRYALHVDLAPGVRTASGTLALRLPEQRGVEGRAEGRGRLAARAPRLVVAEDGWAYHMDGRKVVGSTPLVLAVDADGGGGDWRLALHGATPVVAVAPDAPIAFEPRPVGPGRWALVPRGDWRGARGNTFSGREETVPVTISWAPGGAPGRVAIRVEIRPRWGAAGWILAVLAGLALALALWGLLQLKAAPVDGTLLYQVEGRSGAVGRLDLAAAGRRRALVQADDAGRLSLSPRPVAGVAPVVVVRPTRVGGLLEIPSATPPARHLLVDGLTVSVGRHRIRYVAANPGDATVPAVAGPEEELLGPEFDMPSGRIDALGREDASASGQA